MRAAWALVGVLAAAGCAGGAAVDDVDGGAPAADPRFAIAVVDATIGAGGGFGAELLPDVVLGPPRGGGPNQGSLDVLSLGHGGTIVVELGVDVVDGDGPDLIVFENAFKAGPRTFTEPGEVALSSDGEGWVTFPCAPDDEGAPGCAGLTPVLAHADDDGVFPLDPAAAGGDAFDLATIGLARARFVRVTDRSAAPGDDAYDTGGFDLDAVAVIHASVDPG